MADLRSLSVLAAVVRHRSFTRAAGELHVAQQAVSRTVARLEAELGIALVHRSTRHVDPTEAGLALAAEAESLSAGLDAALARAREIGGAPSSSLLFGVSPGLSQTEVSRFLDALRAALPDTQVDLIESRPGAVAGQLRDNLADLVLARFAQPGPGRQLVALGTTAAGIAVPRSHRFARRRRQLTLPDLAGEPVLIWSRNSAGTDALHEMFAGVDVRWTLSGVVGRDGLADVASAKAIAVWPVDDHPRPEVRVVALDPPLALPVVAVLRRGTPTAAIRQALGALQAALRLPDPPS